MTATKAGRRPMDSAKRAREVSIEARHIDMLDRLIEAERGRNLGFLHEVGDADPKAGKRQTALAARRRHYLGRLIEQAEAALLPTSVHILAPVDPMMASLPEFREQLAEAQAWLDAETQRLSDEAPDLVAAALLMNLHARAMHDLRRDPAAAEQLRRELLAGSGADE